MLRWSFIVLPLGCLTKGQNNEASLLSMVNLLNEYGCLTSDDFAFLKILMAW